MSGPDASDIQPVVRSAAEPTDNPAPLPVLPLEYAPPPPGARSARAWRSIARLCLAVAGPFCLITLLIIPFRVESVVVTGPILFTLGVLSVLGGLFMGDRLITFVGACHCGVCVLFFVLVNLFRWSPDQARMPFLIMGSIYTAAIAYPTVLALSRRSMGATQ